MVLMVSNYETNGTLELGDKEMRLKKLCVGLAGMALGFTAVAADLGPTLNKIRTSGVMTIGYNETSIPFSFTGNGGKAEGYAVELCQKVADRVKSELGLPNLEIRYVPATSQTRIPLLTNGTVDIECSSTTETLTRNRQVDFSFNHYITGTKCMARKDSNVAKVDDLDGKTIALVQGSTTERHLDRIAKQRGVENLRVLNIKSFTEGLIAVETGRADTFCTDETLIRGLHAKSRKKEDIMVMDEMLSVEPYALMLPRNDSEFRLLVNKTLAAEFRDKNYEGIFNKWLAPLGFELDERTRLVYQLTAKPE